MTIINRTCFAYMSILLYYTTNPIKAPTANPPDNTSSCCATCRIFSVSHNSRVTCRTLIHCRMSNRLSIVIHGLASSGITLHFSSSQKPDVYNASDNT